MITLSENAAKKIEGLVADRPEGAGLRIKVIGGGCSGLQYRMEIDQAKKLEGAGRDRVFEFGKARLIVDSRSLLYLNGSKIDYVEGLASSGFKVINPNVKHTCGCGMSFVA